MARDDGTGNATHMARRRCGGPDRSFPRQSGWRNPLGAGMPTGDQARVAMLLYRARESGRVIIRAFGAGKLRFRHGSVQRRALGVVGLLYF